MSVVHYLSLIQNNSIKRVYIVFDSILIDIPDYLVVHKGRSDHMEAGSWIRWEVRLPRTTDAMWTHCLRRQKTAQAGAPDTHQVAPIPV